jgi:hypothetical protein
MPFYPLRLEVPESTRPRPAGREFQLQKMIAYIDKSSGRAIGIRWLEYLGRRLNSDFPRRKVAVNVIMIETIGGRADVW